MTTSAFKSRPIWQWSACDLAGAIRTGDLSSVEAVDAVLKRVSERNGAVNAIVDDLAEDARARAKWLDEVAVDHGAIGPLHGVPVTVKVNVDCEGRATTNGVTGFKDVIAPADAPVVRNLKNAGAVIIGRTNTPEFSFRATTQNPLHGRTRNPWDETRSPGGSSGGASAALAAGFGPIAHGNDIAGSLRFPAFMCGAVTVRPTLGRVPAYNPSLTAERPLLSLLMSVQGVIAREVRDVRVGTKVVAAADPRDPWHVPVPFDGPSIDPPIRVAISRATNGYAIDPAIVGAIDRAADALDRAGYRVEEATPPMLEEIAGDALPALMGDAALFMKEAFRTHGSETVNRVLDAYFEIYPPRDPEALLKAMAQRTRYARAWNEFAETYPLVLTPFLMRPTFDWDEDERGVEAVRNIFESALYSWAINYLGLPAAIAPAGFHDGLPISVQIVAQRFREDLALDAAAALERENGIAMHTLWDREAVG